MRFVITGGHLTPAYSFAEKAVSNGDKILMIGSQTDRSVEATELSNLGATYNKIIGVKYDRYHILKSLLRLPLLIVSLLESIVYLIRFKPHAVVSFGSFNAVPVHIAAWLLGIPSILHEQTRHIGLANKVCSHFANICCISYQESAHFFPVKKVRKIGNILRKDIFNPPLSPSFSVPTHLPILYITGGNQGSAIIIKTIKEILPKLVTKYQVVLQYGNQVVEIDPSINDKIVTKAWFSAADSSWLLHHARIIIGRGGANTTAELMVTGTPAIIIPLPNTTHDEQFHNAKYLAEHGAAEIILQSQLSPETILHTLKTIETVYDQYKHKSALLSSYQNLNAVDELYSLVEGLTK